MSDFNYRGKLPFRIVSSSVNTGYNAELTAAVGRNIEVVNQHRDEYGALQDAPLQGPFTEQWVGGNQHRHIPLNEPRLTEQLVEVSVPGVSASYTYSIDGAEETLDILTFTSLLPGTQGNAIRVTVDYPFDENESINISYGEEGEIFVTIAIYGDGDFGFYVEGLADYVNNPSNWPDGIQLFTVEVLSLSIPIIYYGAIYQENLFGGTDEGTTLVPQLVTKLDDPTNRPEAFLISGSTNKVRVYGPAHFDTLAPKALFTRDVVSKSPVSIKNISNQGRRLGNFTNNYQVVQTSGRDINESLIENNLTASGVLTTKFIEGVPVYSLPEEPNKTKSVFVERFSAPGDWKESSRGALDRESEQYSPNNSLVTRNISVRKRQNALLTQHMPQFGSGSTFFLTPIMRFDPTLVVTKAVSYHKVNRNSILKTSEEASCAILTEIPSIIFTETDGYLQVEQCDEETALIGNSFHDNFWVQHAIPATDLRYKWIKDSIINTGSLIRYQEPYESSELLFNSASLVVSGTNKQFEVDNIGINSIVKNKKSINLQTNTFTITQPRLSASFSEIVNTPYGFSSWREIRGEQHPITQKLRSNNIISIQGDIKESTKRSNFVRQYTESPVTKKFKPLELRLDIKGASQNYDFVFTHTNNLSTFANTELSDRLGLDENSQQMADVFRKFYSNPNRATDSQNPINNLVSFKYTETVYPREVNTYLAETRARTQYILDQAGTGSRDGYDIQLGTQRAFWRDEQEDRTRSDNKFNSMNYQVRRLKGDIEDLPVWREGRDLYFHLFLNAFEHDDFGTSEPSTDPMVPLPVPQDFLPWGESIKPFDSREQKQFSESSYYFEIFDADGSPSFGNVEGKIRTIDNKNSGELNSNLFVDYFYSSSIGITGLSGPILSSSQPPVLKQLMRVTDYSVLWQINPFVFEEDSSDILTGYSSFSSSLPIPKPSFTAFLGGFESGSRNYNQFTPQFPLESDIFKNQPSGTILSTLDSGLRYDEESFGDKKPWFDSYEHYSDDIRSYAKDHSILPEFKISSHIPYYVTEKGGNFRVRNSSYLELDGVGQNYRSSLTASSIAYNKNFINSYVTTDVLDNQDLQKENTSLLKLQNIKFSVSGIKKLLPYNGFYPQERTIQLANLFNEFLEENIGGGCFRFEYDFIKEGSKNSGYTSISYYVDDKDHIWSKNVVIPYFFAPGILYNTIKSGISVDFPNITSSFQQELISLDNSSRFYTTYREPYKQISILSKNTPLLDSTTSVLADKTINRKDDFNFDATVIRELNNRFPFESLIFPEKYIPKVKINSSSFAITTQITGSPTALRPELYDEQLENIFRSLTDNSLLSVKFDCNIRPDIYRQNLYIGNSHLDTVPNFIGLAIDYKKWTPFAFLKNNQSFNPSYSMAMSNFLAEVPRFFLKNNSMNVFKSAELKDWKNFEIGKKYYFDLIMKKSPDLVMIESYKSDNHITGTDNIEKTFNGRYFGWPVDKQSSEFLTVEESYVAHNDPAYAPFTPPYFEGEARLTFELSASKSSYNNVREIFNDITLVNKFADIEKVLNSDSIALQNKMSIQDCMEIFGIGLNPIASFDGLNNANSFEKIPNPSKEYWAISPKLETPVLDFSEQQFIQHTGSYWKSSGYGRGLWSGYGKIPTGSKGITIEIAETFPLQTINRNNLLSNTNKTGSLLQQVGFTAETAKIGQLAEKKTISEAIVMIPYVDNRIPGVTTFVDNHHFFVVNKDAFRTQKEAAEKGIPAVVPNERIGYETSMMKMIKGMKNYVIPPAFNFLKYENIDPFAMYIFEFKHDLDQQDLADIWQGVMPKIAMNAEHDVLEFEHKVGPLELFEENFTPPENMRWLVFKVKKKAEWNYFAITENIADDQNFKFKFSNSQEAKTPDYSYNWPYDYFSLVELAKVDISLTYEPKPQPSGSMLPVIGQYNIKDIIENVAVDDFFVNNKKALKKASAKTRKANKNPGKKK
jgi:hypothetical protein